MSLLKDLVQNVLNPGDMVLDASTRMISKAKGFLLEENYRTSVGFEKDSDCEET